MRSTSVLLLSSAMLLAQGASWPQFRGNQASGVEDQQPLPESWEIAKNSGLKWRTAVPGLSHASAVVAGDRLFVVTAVAKGGKASLKIGAYGAGDSAEDMVEHSFQVWCLRLDDGRVDWVRTAVRCVPKFARHTKATHADPTPVTDGQHVIAVFGAQGMFCYTVAGDVHVVKAGKDFEQLGINPLGEICMATPAIANGTLLFRARSHVIAVHHQK